MKRSTRFEPLANIAATQARDAARRLAARMQDVRSKEAEVERLRGYLAEYTELSHGSSRSVPSDRWHNEQRFLARLGEAVAIQETDLADAVQQLREEIERWRQSHRHSQGLEQLVASYTRNEALERERGEQEEVDELAAARGRRYPNPLA